MPIAPEAPLLEMRGICKQFPGVRALNQVDFTVRRGEVHALLGENGAGKSTLIKVLTGFYPRDAGEVRLDGRNIDPRSPGEAQYAGISTVYQEVNLVPELSVAENITLGRQPRFLGMIQWRRVGERARRAMGRLGIEIDVSRPLSSYSIAIQQMVAIARALDISARLLILDEPTSSLDANEVKQLFRVMSQLREQGMGIVFVTHFLDQVYEVSDRITVLRNGELVGEYGAATLPRVELVAKMMGRELASLAYGKAASAVGGSADVPFMEARGLGRSGAISPFDLRVNAGAVTGLAGLLGSGRTEVARLLFGIDVPEQGSLSIEGRAVSIRSPRDAVRYGIGMCPEDRKVQSIIPDLSIRENIILALQAARGWVRALPRKKQEELAGHYMKALGIAAWSMDQPIKTLSGGNQQKAILARWLALDPRLLILDEPTRGIDVGAKADIQKLVLSLCREGRAVLFISSELEEVVRCSDRVAVLRDKRKVAELAGGQITEHAIMETIAREGH